jgi:hypothetical protein
LTRAQLSHPPARLSTSTDALTPFTRSETLLYGNFNGRTSQIPASGRKTNTGFVIMVMEW